MLILSDDNGLHMMVIIVTIVPTRRC